MTSRFSQRESIKVEEIHEISECAMRNEIIRENSENYEVEEPFCIWLKNIFSLCIASLIAINLSLEHQGQSP